MRERELDPSASPAAFFGNEVREARISAKMSQSALGAATGYDATYVSKVENGHIVPDEKFLQGLDSTFPGMNGWFTRFWRDSRKWNGHYREWFKFWVSTEGRASVIRWYEPMLVPGLAQTEDYAREVLSWGPLCGNVEEDVRARMKRQEILNRDEPPELWLLLAESVLRNRVGPAGTMKGQINHLSELARRPNVTVQVIPDNADAYGGRSGAFAIATVEPSGSLAYLETGLRGMTSDDPMMIRDAARMFEHLRADALGKRPTFDLLAEAGELWNS
jgi:transcriptional regulator with XRE-family HTH domain